MNVWIIEPRDPLIVRDGRPFDSTPGARSISLDFPFPSTTTGGVRTRDGLGTDGRFQKSEVPRVKQLRVHGPLPVELDTASGEISEWLIPKPADALLLGDTDDAQADLKQLVPLERPPGTATNLPDGLSLVGLQQPDPRKPNGRAPCYWRWNVFQKWLLNQLSGQIKLDSLGHDGPAREVRTHVSINEQYQTAEEGRLFQTRGLEFTHMMKVHKLSYAQRLGIAVATDAPNLREGFAPLGSERRLMCWRQSARSLPACPTEIRESLLRDRHCRIVLLTPACFFRGYLPSWILSQRHGVTPSLKAVAVNRPQVVSGWDFEIGKPKPTRRLAPAGSVLFIELKGEDNAIRKWIEAIWMHCISDGEQDQRDGFGLAVLGIWDGKLRSMEVSS